MEPTAPRHPHTHAWTIATSPSPVPPHTPAYDASASSRSRHIALTTGTPPTVSVLKMASAPPRWQRRVRGRPLGQPPTQYMEKRAAEGHGTWSCLALARHVSHKGAAQRMSLVHGRSLALGALPLCLIIPPPFAALRCPRCPPLKTASPMPSCHGCGGQHAFHASTPRPSSCYCHTLLLPNNATPVATSHISPQSRPHL